MHLVNFFHHPKCHPILSSPTNLGYYWSIFWRFHHMHVKLFSHSSAKNCFDLLIIISSPLLMTVESNYFIRMGSTCKDFTIVYCSKTRKKYVFRINPSRPLAFWKFQHFLDCLGFKAVLVPLVSISTKRNASQRYSRPLPSTLPISTLYSNWEYEGLQNISFSWFLD